MLCPLETMPAMLDTAPMPPKKRAKAPKTGGINVKASDEWTDWARRGAEKCGMSISQAVDMALRAIFKRHGFDEPAPKR